MATTLGTSVAVGALLVMAMLPAASSALRLERGAVLAGTVTACQVGDFPGYPGYDPVTQEMYVPNEASANITVLSGTCTVAGTITLPSGAEPIQAAFDPGDNYMFVTDNTLNQIYEISGTKIVRTITSAMVAGQFDGPFGITYDPTFYSLLDAPVGAMFVTNGNGDSIAVVEPCPSGSYFGECPSDGVMYYAAYTVGSAPESIAYDPGDGDLWVTNSASNTVSAVDAFPYGIGKSTTVQTFPAGGDPGEVAIDLATGFVYVPDYSTNNVTVIEGSPAQDEFGSVIGSISGNGPAAAAWDQSTLQMFIANYGNSKVFVVGGNSGLKIIDKQSTYSGWGAFGIAYDGANGDMYVTNFGNNEVYVLS